MIRFVIDPSLVREALESGHKLVVEVRSPTHYRVTALRETYPPLPQKPAA